MALKQSRHYPPRDEKALESGGKSEDQPFIGRMPNALDVSALGDTFFY
jgi:hypothetical protein